MSFLMVSFIYFLQIYIKVISKIDEFLKFITESASLFSYFFILLTSMLRWHVPKCFVINFNGVN